MDQVIHLPELPQGKEFEEYLSAFFQSSGYFVERNLIDRQKEDVLELDIFLTDYQPNSAPALSLVEVKGGDWGFNEIFKIRGWLTYLNLNSGCLLVKEQRNHFDFYKRLASSLDIKVISIPNLEKTKEYLHEFSNSIIQVKDEDVSSWRYSYWTERVLLQRLTRNKKADESKKSYKALDRYFSLVNNGTFFKRNVVERAEGLYPGLFKNLSNALIIQEYSQN